MLFLRISSRLHIDVAAMAQAHNERPVWDFDAQHSFCWVNDADARYGGFWALANLETTTEGVV